MISVPKTKTIQLTPSTKVKLDKLIGIVGSMDPYQKEKIMKKVYSLLFASRHTDPLINNMIYYLQDNIAYD